MYDEPDEGIVAKIQAGEIQLFEVILRRYQKKLLTFIYSIVGSEADADDIVQDAFISVYKHIDNLDPARKFSPYLFQTAKNMAYSFFRERPRRQVNLDNIGEIEFDAGIFEQLVEEEEYNKVKQILSRMDIKYSRMLRYYYLEDLSYMEISRKEKIPLNTVRTRIKRAKDIFRKLLSL
jgi:RNA polymerase sigma-70 factor (ECF subfamily)